MTTNRAMRQSESNADFCRRMGFGVGTRLAGNEGYGETIIEITAIGHELILARKVSHCGVASMPIEGSWNLSGRDWRRVPVADGYWGA